MPEHQDYLMVAVLLGFVCFLGKSAQEAFAAQGMWAKVCDVVRGLFGIAMFLVAIVYILLWVLKVVQKFTPNG